MKVFFFWEPKRNLIPPTPVFLEPFFSPSCLLWRETDIKDPFHHSTQTAQTFTLVQRLPFHSKINKSSSPQGTCFTKGESFPVPRDHPWATKEVHPQSCKTLGRQKVQSSHSHHERVSSRGGSYQHPQLCGQVKLPQLTPSPSLPTIPAGKTKDKEERQPELKFWAEHISEGFFLKLIKQV